MRLWLTTGAVALALAFGVAPAQAVPFVYVSGISPDFLHRGELFQFDVGAGGLLKPLSPPTAVTVSDFFSQGALAVSPDGQNVYLGGLSGDPEVYGGLFGAISQYDVGAGGTLSPKSPPTVTLAHDDFPSTDSPQALAVSPDGQSVYVANLSSGDISQYDVGASGALSPKSPPTDVAGGFGVAVSPPRVPMRKEQCKRDGWRTFPQYRNEGQCVSFVQRHP